MRATICTNSIEQPIGGQRWYSDRELRDDRTTFFNFYFPQGQHEYVYLLKVVNPGVFHVSPTSVRAHVSAGVSFDQRCVNGDGEMTAKHKGVAKLWLLNLIGNAVLLAAVYFWLLLPDAHGWQVAASAFWRSLSSFSDCGCAPGSFAYFRVAEFRDHATVWRAFRHALRHMIALGDSGDTVRCPGVVAALTAQICAAVWGVVLAEGTGVFAAGQPAASVSRR